jgi:hypothetical protein
MLTPEEQAEIAAIKARLEAITPGPWKNPGRQFIASHADSSEPLVCDVLNNTAGNIPFIAHAPEDINTLLAIVKRQEKSIGILWKELHSTSQDLGDVVKSQERNITRLESALAEAIRQRDQYRDQLQYLMDESKGVYGWHLNGELEPWEGFVQPGDGPSVRADPR